MVFFCGGHAGAEGRRERSLDALVRGNIVDTANDWHYFFREQDRAGMRRTNKSVCNLPSADKCTGCIIADVAIRSGNHDDLGLHSC